MARRDKQHSAERPEGFNRYENICANQNYETASSLFLFLAHDAQFITGSCFRHECCFLI